MFRVAAARSLRLAVTRSTVRHASTYLRPRSLPAIAIRSTQFTPSISSQAIRCYAAHGGLSKDEVQGRIMDLLKNFDKVSDASKISGTSHFVNDLGLDSLDTVEVVMAIEEEFSIEIPDKEADAIHSVDQAVTYIVAQPDGRSALQISRSHDSQCLRSFATRFNTPRETTEIDQALSQTLPEQIEQAQPPTIPGKKVWSNSNAFYRQRAAARKADSLGTALRGNYYNPQTFENNPPSIEEIDLPLLLASQTHLGHATSLWNPRNSSYITGVRDGIHIISLDVTSAYLRRACKVVTEVARRGGLILFVGTRDRQEDIVVRAAKMSGGYHVFDRWVPGSLTNGQQILGHCRIQVVNAHDKEMKHLRPQLKDQPVIKPDLVICLNPLENEVCLHECGLYDVPTIGIIDTDADASWVTYPIPANDDSMRSVTLIAGALGRAGREGQKQRLKSAAKGELTYQPVDMEKFKMFAGSAQAEEFSDAAPVVQASTESSAKVEGPVGELPTSEENLNERPVDMAP